MPWTVCQKIQQLFKYQIVGGVPVNISKNVPEKCRNRMISQAVALCHCSLTCHLLLERSEYNLGERKHASFVRLIYMGILKRHDSRYSFTAPVKWIWELCTRDRHRPTLLILNVLILHDVDHWMLWNGMLLKPVLISYALYISFQLLWLNEDPPTNSPLYNTVSPKWMRLGNESRVTSFSVISSSHFSLSEGWGVLLVLFAISKISGFFLYHWLPHWIRA